MGTGMNMSTETTVTVTKPTAISPKAYADGFYAGVYTDYSSEELYHLAAGGDETALWTLCRKYEPLFKSEAMPYRDRMADTYDAEDFVSIGDFVKKFV